MSRKGATQLKILTVLSDGKPRTSKEINKELRLGSDSVESALGRLWRSSRVLRTAKPNVRNDRVFKGRAGIVSNQRQYHSYMLGHDSVRSTSFQGQLFVSYSREYLDKRGSVDGLSKAKMILEFIKKNRDRAFYSKELVSSLKERGVKPSDIMSNVRRFEKKGLVYVRGYRMHDKQTPFKEH